MLQGNVLRSTKGIQMLPHLEELDLRYNLIASIHEVVRLSGALRSPEDCESYTAACTKDPVGSMRASGVLLWTSMDRMVSCVGRTSGMPACSRPPFFHVLRSQGYTAE